MNKLQLIDEALKTLFRKLSILDLKKIGISAYNQRYMSEYLRDYSFYAPLYRQLVYTAINDFQKPIETSVFIDYGGGSGLLSLLAKEIGFNQVIYSDIYDVSVIDARIISEQTGIAIDYFVCGNIDELLDVIKHHNLRPNIICSFAVIEHIYKLDDWFNKLGSLENSFCAAFLTSANPYNPLIRKRLMKLQRQAEYQGTKAEWGLKERDSKIPFFRVRKEIIQSLIPQLDEPMLNWLAENTRGLDQKDIRSEINYYLQHGILRYKPAHPTNTCDPYTGNWTERLIDLRELKSHLKTLNFELEITSGLYSFGKNKKLNLIKSVLNQIIKLNNRLGLRVSATYILKLSK